MTLLNEYCVNDLLNGVLMTNMFVLLILYSEYDEINQMFLATIKIDLHKTVATPAEVLGADSTRYVDGSLTSEVTPVTIRYIRPPQHGHTSQYHGHEWMTRIFSFIANRPPHSWDKTISDSDLETPRSRSWVWSKGKVIQSSQYHINSLPFQITSIRPTIPDMELFRNLTLKQPSRSWASSKVKVTYCTQYPTNALPFRFTSIGPTIPEIWPK